MEIYLIRHGRKKDDDLTMLGETQAKILGLYFRKKGIKPDFLYSSPRRRCTKTAEIMKETAGWNIDIMIRDELSGITGPRGDEEKYEKELTRLAQETGKSYLAVKPSGGESFVDMEKRVQRFIEFLKEKHKDDRAFLVTHKNFIRIFICRMLNLPLPFMLRVEVCPATITYFKLNSNFEIEDYYIAYSQHLVDVFEEPISREKTAASRIVYTAVKKGDEQIIKWTKDIGFEEIEEKNGWIIFRKEIL